jgi:hypothetical protein
MGHTVLASKKLFYWVVICCLIVLCSGIFVFSKPALASRLEAWKILPRPERFTELYFAIPEQLPSTFMSARSQPVSFTVHNLEEQKTIYGYRIVAKASSKQQVLAHGQFALAHGESKNITRPILLPPLDERIEVQVVLEYQGIQSGHNAPSLETQSIHYWLNLTT